MYRNGLIRKIRLISKFITPQLRKQTIAIHILLSLSRSKGNQNKKSEHLVEYNMRNSFLEKSYTNMVEKVFPDTSLKYQNWAYFWISSLKFYTVCFYVQIDCYRNILKLSCWPFVFNSFFICFLSWERKEAVGWNKKHFSSFLGSADN